MRITWDKYWLSFLPIISQRATCSRGRASCIIVKNKMIISTGYVGSVPGQAHCDDIGHLIIKQINDDNSISDHCIRTSHCEQNAIAFAAKNGISTNDATIYITMEPCFSCAKLLIQAGIKRVVCLKNNNYTLSNRNLSQELLKQSNVELMIINNESEKYE